MRCAGPKSSSLPSVHCAVTSHSPVPETAAPSLDEATQSLLSSGLFSEGVFATTSSAENRGAKWLASSTGTFGSLAGLASSFGASLYSSGSLVGGYGSDSPLFLNGGALHDARKCRAAIPASAPVDLREVYAFDLPKSAGTVARHPLGCNTTRYVVA